VLFEETQRTLFCSDLLFQFGAQEPLTERDIVGPARESLKAMQASPFSYSVPYTHQTDQILDKLARLQARTLATMHGSSFRGDCGQALRDYGAVIKEVLGAAV
jgi:flavorubredoxin